ncbi:MAG: hypothetical protein IK137_01065 [Bacilli bacterium]|nr:hypothetical protein [Bacilli bacterium]
MENENMVVQPKKKSPVFGILIAIILIACAGLAGWYIGQMNSIEVLKEKVECEKKLTETKTKTVSTPTAKCYGTYTLDGTEGNEKWILKEDGTFKVEGKEEFGVFYVADNTIIFVYSKHTTGPKDKDPSYTSPKAYLISEDCSKITLATGDTGAGLTKQN